MTSALLIVTRFSDLVASGNIEAAANYLALDVTHNSWIGVVNGRDDVLTMLRDGVRFMRHARVFRSWKQVQHCLDPSLRCVLNTGTGSTVMFDSDGYDSHGFATFERDGTIASDPSYVRYNISVKETIVVRDSFIVLIDISKCI